MHALFCAPLYSTSRELHNDYTYNRTDTGSYFFGMVSQKVFQILSPPIHNCLWSLDELHLLVQLCVRLHTLVGFTIIAVVSLA